MESSRPRVSTPYYGGEFFYIEHPVGKHDMKYLHLDFV